MNSSSRPSTPGDRSAQALELINLARQDLNNNERLQARNHAAQAAALAPHLEDPWLILAALASPKASIAYLQRALEINPASGRAQKGMQWALQRLELPRAQPPTPTPRPTRPSERQPLTDLPPSAPALSAAPVLKRSVVPLRPVRRRRKKTVVPAVFVYAFAVLFLSIVLFIISLAPYYPGFIASLPPDTLAQVPVLSTAAAYSFYPTETQTAPTEAPVELAGLGFSAGDSPQTAQPSPEPSATPTPLPTAPPSATPTEPPTATPPPTETPLPTETATLEPTALPTATLAPPTPTSEPQIKPTKKPKKKVAAANPGFRPESVSLNDRWIDVDLSSQRVYAMQGDQIVNSFLVSTGRWPTVTVTGVYKIYVKYRQANMSGDDYFLPNVPNVMYFFKGYGLHGTYWHNNFGTPMSHGCVNLSPTDSAWLFDFASVGTIVSVHE